VNVLKLESIDAAPWGPPALLRDINLNLNSGEILGIIGPNGAGKTSLLHTMAGDITPTKGKLHLMGEKLSHWSPRLKAQSVAVLPQLSPLAFPYRVEEVILLGRTPHSSGHTEDRVILQEVMEATDTARLQHRTYTQLSGGEKQRVQLARVFAQIWRGDNDQPRLLLLDEPTAALDLAHQQLILAALRSLVARHCAVVIVAHDFNLVTAIADQITVMCCGEQIAQGSCEAVVTPDVFSRVFGVDVTIMPHPKSGKPLVFSQ
jgi:iron complex transport system ATP-binding protein